MEVIAITKRHPISKDICSGPDDRIYHREQTFEVPTIESGRFYTVRAEYRMPPRDSAFIVQLREVRGGNGRRESRSRTR
jgi:hypothetical protein